MDNAANVRSIQALRDLSVAIRRFRDESHEAMQDSAKELNDAVEYLRERLAYWKRELEKEGKFFQVTQHLLYQWEQEDSKDQWACHRLQMDLLESRKRHHDVEAECANVAKWLGRVENAGKRYMRESNLLATITNEELVKGTNLLAGSVSTLEAYTATSPDSGSFSFMEKPAMGQQPLTETTIIAVDTADPTWVKRGIVDVLVADLPWPKNITGPDDFENITYEDTMEAIKCLQKIEPLIRQGYTGDDFSDMDEVRGLDYEHGLKRVYELFHGGKAIKVEKDGDKYDIAGGHHRIYIAKLLGLKTIPAYLKERIK